MCRLAVAHFGDSVGQARRHEVVRLILTNSWEMGNKDGVGLATWTADEEPQVARAVDIKDMKLPAKIGATALLHARNATNDVCLANTHPYVGGGVYLVHNGIVQVHGEETAKRLHALAETNNDTELILKAYLAEPDRARTDGVALVHALAKLTGSANLALWDRKARLLELYPDTRGFGVWRQAGITVICQEAEQTAGVIVAGLGRPYETATLVKEQAYVMDLGNQSFDDALATIMERHWAVKRPSFEDRFGGPRVLTFYGDLRPYDNPSPLSRKERKRLARESREADRQIRAEERRIAKRDAIDRARSLHGPLLGLDSRMRGLADTADSFVSFPSAKRPKWLLGETFGKYPADEGPLFGGD
jgi:hypothetical protein